VSGERLLFIECDGAIVATTADRPVDTVASLRLLPGVIAALLDLRRAGYRLVLMGRQDGAGDSGAASTTSRETQDFLGSLLDSQGIAFDAAFFCPHRAKKACDCHKARTGPLAAFLAAHPLDTGTGWVIGDSDAEPLAAALGLRRLPVGGAADEAWPTVVAQLCGRERTARVQRVTKETRIDVAVNLDCTAPVSISTGIGFFDHMLEQVARHGGFALELDCRGDLQVDEHHTVEDCALALGQALREALGDKRGIARYGFLLPMDEARAQVAIDLSGRAFAVFEGEFGRDAVGGLPTELVPHFFRSLGESLGAAIHVQVVGDNSHHMVEACFKGVGRALRQALRIEGTELPSSKGVL
jgi:imidazoleglycerol-phosphate dehydratase/histidinol-phosphatase